MVFGSIRFPPIALKIFNQQENDQTAAHTQRQADNIDQRIAFEPDKATNGNFQCIFNMISPVIS